jgi:hypothetical protein
MANMTTRNMPSDIPSRAVALILNLITIGFLASLDMRFDSINFRNPLVLVSTSI